MTTILELIFGTGAYFYIATILTQYGYTSYFGIPYNFIEFSIKNNVIFFFDLLTIIKNVASNLSAWSWIILGIFSLIIIFLRIIEVLKGSVLTFLIILLAFFSFFGFYNFGKNVAKITTEFKVIPVSCISEEKNITYIIPSFYQTTAVITPIYTDTNTLTGSFLTKESSDLGCEIISKKTGKILPSLIIKN